MNRPAGGYAPTVIDPHDGRNQLGVPMLGETPAPARRPWAAVPWRTIIASVFVVLATVIAVRIAVLTYRVLLWTVVGGFFAVVLAPAVRRVQSVVGGRRGVASGIVVFASLGVVFGTLTMFLMPVRRQLVQILTDLPGTVNDAADGRGTVGRLVTRLGLTRYVRENEFELQRAADDLSSKSFDVVSTAFNVLLAFVTITVIAFLFLTQAEAIGRAALGLVPHRRRESVRATAKDAAAAVSGYMIGNLLISLIAGVTSFVCLFLLDVPNAFVLSLWVAFADLIPLIGATLGAAVASLAAFFEGTTAGIIAVSFYIAYQQIENYLIYPSVMSRRVNVNPLIVLLSVLVGVELFGIIGALLAVPVSGALQVIAKSIQRARLDERLVLPEGIETSG